MEIQKLNQNPYGQGGKGKIVVVKKIKSISFLFIILFIAIGFSAAQDLLTGIAPLLNSDNRYIYQAENYYIVETREGIRFIQRLRWYPMEYVYRYEVIIEQQDQISGVFKEIVNESTEESFIEVSLSAGRYRYKVKVFNLLDRPDGESDWQDFEVFRAIQPRVDSFTPRNFYLDEESTRTITISGQNFKENAEIFLVPRRIETIIGISASGIFPDKKKVFSSGELLEISFKDADLSTGIFDIIVRNPGGLMDSAGPFNIISSHYSK